MGRGELGGCIKREAFQEAKVGNMKANTTFATLGRVLWIVVKRGPYVVCYLGGVKNLVEDQSWGNCKHSGVVSILEEEPGTKNMDG